MWVWLLWAGRNGNGKRLRCLECQFCKMENSSGDWVQNNMKGLYATEHFKNHCDGKFHICVFYTIVKKKEYLRPRILN
jgi:hypothetical protein